MIKDSSTEYSIIKENAIKSSFTHILGRIKGTTLDLFIDGSLAGSATITPFEVGKTMNNNFLGIDINLNNNFNGIIAYFKTWLDYSLLPNEIIDLYDNRIEPEPEPFLLLLLSQNLLLLLLLNQNQFLNLNLSCSCS